MADGTSAVLHINRLKRAYGQMGKDSALPLHKSSSKVVKLSKRERIAPRDNIETGSEESDVVIPSHSRKFNVEENEQSDESDGGVDGKVVDSPRRRSGDPEWSPGSVYLQKRLRSNNTAEGSVYKLRSRLVGRSEREAEADKEQSETDRLSESEYVVENTQNKVSPGKNKSALSHSYNLRSRLGPTSNDAQK
jgi:hypothetical protein